MTDWSRGRIIIRSYELHFIEAQSQVVYCFLDEIGVFISNVPELRGWDPNKKNRTVRMTVARWFQPGIVGMSIDLLLERVENPDPGVGYDGSAGQRHMSAHRNRMTRWIAALMKL